MTWPFDDGSAFPVFDGLDVGGQQARTMAERAGGYSGIRTVIEQNPDGSITTLRTRNGNPIYETTSPTSASTQADLYRGFVAKASSRAVLFDPYTLEILNANYTPALNTYTVLDFATSWNVAPDDTTNWFDVALFDGSTIKINGKAMPTLGITANHGFPAVPYVINRGTSDDEYGNAERNTTEKRVFAVGRYEVKSWGGGGVSAVLTPAAARSDNKAMTIGQRISGADKAMLSQFYFTGTNWDSLSGGWALSSIEVTMLLALPYLTSVSGSSTVDQVVCSPVSTGTTTTSSSVSTTLPSVELCAVGGVGELGASVFAEGTYTMFQWVHWPASETFSYDVPGYKNTTGTADSWSDVKSASPVVAGRVIEYLSDNSITKTSYSETYAYDAFSAPLFATLGGGTAASYQGTYHASGGGYYVWPTPTANLAPRDAYGSGEYAHSSGNLGSSANYTTSSQSGSASATLVAIDLVSVSFSRYKESGDQIAPTPITGRYDDLINNHPTEWRVPSSGYYEYLSSMQVEMYAPEPLHGDVIGKRPPLIAAKASEIAAAGKFYDNENSHNNTPLYTPTITARPTIDTQSLNWNTTDYILYDETNGVYISVIASFVGAQAYGGSGSGTLTVSWKVESPSGTVTQQIHEEVISYTELLPESLLTTGVYYVPSPKIRAVFAPLYQEQGSFRGAHYVTQSEVSNGATAFHGFNFFLKLRPYADIAAVNSDNDSGPNVNFVPVNLLEMLYAYVYSSKYGVDAFARYPVDRTATFNSITDALFTTGFRVSVKNGTQTNWADVFGSDFASISTVSLHRV